MTISGASKGRKLALLDRGVVGLGLQQAAGQKELLGQLLIPLLAQVGRRDDQDAPLALRPLLREHQARLDGFAQAHFVGQQRALRERRSESKQGSIDLMRIQIDLRVNERRSELLDAVRREAAGQLVGEVLGVVVGEAQSCSFPSWVILSEKPSNCLCVSLKGVV